MKKILTVLAIIALVSSVSVGQMTITKGIKGGLNFATLGGSDIPANVKGVTQFSGGMYFNLSLPFGFSVQPEVLYTVKGYKASNDKGNEGSPNPLTTKPYLTNEQSIEYLEIPILIKYALPTFSIVKPDVYVGASFGGRLGAKQSVKDSLTSVSVDNKSLFSDKEIGIVFGAGATFNAGPIDAVLDLRYNMGIWKIDRPEKMNINNRGFVVMAGIVL